MTQEYKDKAQNMSPTERVLFGGLGLGLLAFAASKPSNKTNLALGAVGAVFAAGAALGRSPYNAALNIRRTQQGGIHVRKAITIGVPAEQVYRFWRQYENLPQFMSHLESVTQRDERVSHWVAKAPLGTDVAWDAETTEDIPNRRIAWRSIEGSTIPNEGHVEVRDAPGDRGTEVPVELQYHPPGGTVGAGIARLLGEEPGQQVADDLLRLKRILEIGQVPTAEGQTSGRKPSGE